jgi:outer membrane protein assembly factor BamB
MKFFSLFSSNRITPLWQFTADATLWRIMFSQNGMIIGEDRNTESKSVSFFCLNASDGSVLWKHKTFEEPWWIGLSGVTSDRLYLHGFKKPDMPEQKNIISVDLTNGTVVWKNTDCAFLALSPPNVFGYRDLFERRLYYRLDDRTGLLQEEMNELPADIPENGQYEKTDFTFSRLATPDLDAELWPLLAAEEGFVSADIISTSAYHVVNIYQKNPGDGRDLKNSLAIIDTATKKKVYSDVLNGSTAYAVPDSFFMDGHRVYYIKERKTFVALDLPT